MKRYAKALLVGCITLPFHTAAFKPSEDKWGGVVWSNVKKNHLTVTKNGIKEISINGEVLKFSPEAIEEVQKANAEVDKHEEEIQSAHCDAETIGGPSGCSKRMVDIKSNIVTLLSSTTSPDVQLARKELGRALHTLQDFYAHSNWVNKASRQDQIYTALTNTSPYLPVQDQYERKEDIASNKTCQWDLESFDERPLATATLDKRGLEVITTGWFAGFYGMSDPIYYKCDHGIADGNGLNKDSQHQPLHDEAIAAATSHTNAFTKDIITQVLNSDSLTSAQLTRNIDKFLGLLGDSSIGFVVDTTGSMEETIEGVKNAIQNTVNRLSSEGKDVTKFYLISYGDPGVGSVLSASDSSQMLANIATVQLCVPDCGGDTPEKALDGLLKMVNTAIENTHIYLYTDANTKNPDLASAIIKVAKEKNLKINFFLSGFGDSSYNLIANATEGNIYSYAHTIAGAEGTFAYINPQFEGNVEKLLTISGNIPGELAQQAKPQQTQPLAKANSDPQAATEHYYALPANEMSLRQKNGTKAMTNVVHPFVVSDSSTKIYVNVNMEPLGIVNLIRPDGTPVLHSDEGVTITNTNASSNIVITEMLNGQWGLEVLGNPGQAYDLDIDVASDVRVIDFGFKEIKGRAGHEGFFPIDGEPTRGAEQFVSLSFVGDINNLTMAVELLDGTVFSQVELNQVLSNDLTSRYLGKAQLPQQSFNLVVRGNTASDTPFIRTISQVFEPQVISVKPLHHKPVIFSPNTKYDIGFEISNLGDSDNFEIVAQRQDGTPITLGTNTINIASEASKEVRVQFTTPDDLGDANQYSVTLTATSTTDPDSSNYAIFTSSISILDTDGDGIVDSAEDLVFDGNSDGTLDSQQANVVSFLSKSAIGFSYQSHQSRAFAQFFSGELDRELEASLAVSSDFGYVAFELLNQANKTQTQQPDPLAQDEIRINYTGTLYPSRYYRFDSDSDTWVEDTTAVLADGYALIKVSANSHQGFFDFSNQLPQVYVDPVSTVKDQSISIDLLANASDPDGDVIEITEIDEVSLENGTIVRVADSANEVVYTPASGFIGTDHFSFTVTDNKGGFKTTQVEIVTTEPPPTPDPTPEPQPDSGGGSFGLGLLMLLGIGARRRWNK